MAYCCTKLSLRLPACPSAVQWATFPLLQLVFQLGDWQGLAENQTKGTTLHGANNFEKATVVAGKLIHYSIIAVLPALLHGLPAAALGTAAYMATQVRSVRPHCRWSLCACSSHTRFS